MIVGGQVDRLRPDRSKVGRQFQPQLVAVGPQRLDGAQSLPGVHLQARGAFMAHIVSRSFPLLHDIAGQVSPPATEINGNKMAIFLTGFHKASTLFLAILVLCLRKSFGLLSL